MGQKRGRSGSVSSMPSTDSPFRLAKLETTMSLPPAYIGREAQGINELLNDRLLKFDARLGGVMLSYSSVRLVHRFGRVFGDSPEVLFRVKLRCLVFFAPKGTRLAGRVKQVSAGHVTLLVYGAFQVIVHAAELPERYVFAPSSDGLSDRFVARDDKDDVLEQDVEAKVAVMNVQGGGSGSRGASWHVEGSMRGEGLGAVETDPAFAALLRNERAQLSSSEDEDGAGDGAGATSRGPGGVRLVKQGLVNSVNDVTTSDVSDADRAGTYADEDEVDDDSFGGRDLDAAGRESAGVAGVTAASAEAEVDADADAGAVDADVDAEADAKARKKARKAKKKKRREEEEAAGAAADKEKKHKKKKKKKHKDESA